MGISITIEDHSEEFLRELDAKVPVALEECGLVAEGYAKRLCTVDTGLLRNSITHAAGGESPAIVSYRASKGSNRGKTGKRLSAGSKNAGLVKVGFYDGTAPNSSDGEYSMYIGTNVEYAPYVEMGTIRTRAQPFIKPAIINHINQYKQIIKRRLKG